MAKTKPTISPRKPPGAVDPAAAAGFVAGHAPSEHSDAQTSGNPPRASSKASSIITRQDGRELKRTTVYLPPATAKRLAVRCAELEMELSTAMTEAIEAWLRAK